MISTVSFQPVELFSGDYNELPMLIWPRCLKAILGSKQVNKGRENTVGM